MAIPLPTTTITVRRVPADPNRDPYDPAPEPVVVASGVPAHISLASGRENVAGGSQEIVNFRLACNPFAGGIHHEDTVVNDQSGAVYEVVFAEERTALGLDHFQAGLRQVTGVVS